ncbi:hypothetical protein C7T94_06305 [Pedobacter yulinensis]|uniref:Lipocalin-like domain-containing protein n=1 Tax=Pedobacter yulinensis TaxID=2126353 RepID=A0A2T3HPF2_9SPHI|nr:lipocalin family protein [Pedobacter yulinensis]PST84324.1 hypothetical protein C7T94_06305 [Pedobacter yulinensis]
MRKLILPFVAAALSAASCTKTSEKAGIQGTWQLLSAKTITGKDTLATFPVAGQEMIKVINASHFAFFRHDTSRGKGSSAVYDSGAGTYSLNGSTYQEKLNYCSARDWEGHSFSFQVRLSADSLVQTGTEKIDSLGIDRQIIEVYQRVK